jgi:hypothetical protein
MRALFEHGRATGLNGAAWATAPPVAAAPPAAASAERANAAAER